MTYKESGAGRSRVAGRAPAATVPHAPGTIIAYSTTPAPHAHDHDDDTPRCRVCHHPLTARRSIALELGPVCAHRLAHRLTLAAGAPVALGERDGELLAWIGRAPR